MELKELVGNKLLILGRVPVNVGTIYVSLKVWEPGTVTPKVESYAKLDEGDFLIFTDPESGRPLLVNYEPNKMAIAPESRQGVGSPFNLVRDVFDKAGVYLGGVLDKALTYVAIAGAVYFAFILYQNYRN